MATLLERLLELYKDLCKVPIVSNAWITKSGSKAIIGISSLWSQTDLVRNEKIKLERNYTIDVGTNPLQPKVIYRSNPVESIENCRNISNTGAYTAVLKEIVPGKKSSSSKAPEKSEFLDIFSNNLYIKENCIDLKSLEKHGKVDSSFGTLNFSNGEGHLLYVAEKFRKPAAFFDPKFDQEKYAADPSTDEFFHVESWGERLAECKEPLLCILDISSGNTTVIDNIPGDISPYEPVWGPGDEGICFVGLSNVPSKLGLGACFNRRSSLLYYCIKEASCIPLVDYEAAFRSIRFSPDQSKFVFLEAKVGGPHRTCESMHVVDWKSKTRKIVVSVVDSPADESSFPGLYESNLPNRCWALDNTRVLLGTTWHSNNEIVVVDVNKAQITCLTRKGAHHGSWQLLDVFDDYILASNSAPNRPPVLMLAQLPPKGQEFEKIVWAKLDSVTSLFDQLTSSMKWEILKYKRPASESEPDEFSNMEYEGILCSSEDGCRHHCSEKKVAPLIVISHGGPHSTYVTAWSPIVAFFILSGYSVLRVNYRGSLGYGDKFVRSLPGNVGVTDVLDSKNAIEVTLNYLHQQSSKEVMDAESKHPVFLYGGSHGGFLTAHLIGQFPNLAKAAIVANPVLNISTMLFESDIPDWAMVCCFNEAYDPAKVVTEEQMAEMLKKSPIYHVEKIKTPLLLAIGQNDMRVPNAQIFQYVRILKARGIPVKVMSYPSNGHSLANVDSEANFTINTLLWFENYLSVKQQ